MAVIYNLAILIFGHAARIAALFNHKAKLFINGRKGIWKQLEAIPKNNIVWFHAASLGEFEQGKPVIEALKKARPEIHLVVTFFSPSGYEQRKNYAGAHVFYLPLDTPANAKRFVKMLNPRLAVFIRYEFWANYLDALHNANVPTAVMSAQFRANQFAFGPFGGYIRTRILRLRAILVQYESAKSVLLAHGANAEIISLCGDSRFDRTLQTVQAAQTIDEIERFKKDAPIVVLGSCYAQEIAFAKPLFAQFPHWKFIYAPHHVDETTVQNLLAQLPEKAVRFSRFAEFTNERILVLDTIGKLAAAYRYGEIAIVGGGFTSGIHNIIEPAAFGLPLFYGPRHAKFPEGQAFIDAGLATEIDASGLAEKRLATLLTDAQLRSEVSEKTALFVQQHAGATECITNKLNSLF
jgi:3-deoxy-D-manno-octulosonic-acid transferase